uniref:Uncharacterized protein n=1 Tax=Candidatus Caldatribacterium californiense TaxID=1454726 RepID=A0A7V3YLS1_9BACT
MPSGQSLVFRNEDIQAIVLEIPEGHKHLRTTIVLQDGTTLIFQEATVANLVRAYVTVKTHPTKQRVALTGVRLPLRKEGYAEWQLLEEDEITPSKIGTAQKSPDG